jgi:hypothetical protein
MEEGKKRDPIPTFRKTLLESGQFQKTTSAIETIFRHSWVKQFICKIRPHAPPEEALAGVYGYDQTFWFSNRYRTTLSLNTD